MPNKIAMTDHPKLVLSSILAKRTFSLQDQNEFAMFSGDFNPIHIDPIAARRTLMGQCIVHGMHCLIWALESLLLKQGLTVSSFKIRFLKPVLLNEEITCVWNPENNRMTLLADGVTLITITVCLGVVALFDLQDELSCVQSEIPDAPGFSKCLTHQDRLIEVGANPKRCLKLFPSFCKVYGTAMTCDLAAASYVVGMKCPGQHSLFASFTATLRQQTAPPRYSVVEGDERFSLLQIAFNGKTLDGQVEAFYRPIPAQSQTIGQISEYVSRNEFKAIKALVVGGSRGLGEVVAKLIAAGGGKVVITYHVGEAEAQSVSNEILQWGGNCQYIQFSATEVEKYLIDYSSFNQIYYFATPKISGKRTSQFDQTQRSSYHAIYVDAFNSLCKALINADSHSSVLYPSSVFLENTPKGLEDYVIAKREGEHLCDQLNMLCLIKILTKRLPQLPTDQNQALLEGQMTDTVECLLPIIREMSTL